MKDDAGSSVPGARVVLEGVSDPRLGAGVVAGETGAAIFPRVPPGEYRIGAAREGEPRRRRTFSWDIGMAPVEVTVEGAAGKLPPSE